MAIKLAIIIIAFWLKGIWAMLIMIGLFFILSCRMPKHDTELMYILNKQPKAKLDTIGVDSAGIVHLKFNVGFCFHAFNGEIYSYPCEVE